MNRPGISVLNVAVQSRNAASPINVTRRWFDWDPRVTRKDGKPAITGTKAAYVAAQIPVVLTRDIEGLGPKGTIVEVKRGFARNVLVPNGDAVYGTLWENIDAFADPKVSEKQQVEKESVTAKQIVPFDWLNGVRLEFLRDTTSDSKSKLESPISIREVLTAISIQESIDLLPSQVEFPQGGLETVGRHLIPITLNLSTGIFTYTIKIEAKDKAEVAAAERREAELREAMKMKRPEFVLGSSRLSKKTIVSTGEDREDSEEESSDDEENK